MRRFVAIPLLAFLSVCAQAQSNMDISHQFKFQNVNSNLVLGISGMSQQAGTATVQWYDDGTADHLWHLIPEGNSEYAIENMYTHQVLGVTNMSTSDGAQIVQWSDNNTADHLWRFYQQSDGSYMIQNVNSGLYLEVYYADKTTSAIIDQWGNTRCSCQKWWLNSSGSAYASPGYVYGNGTSVHDPMLLKDSSGTYWLYGTHNTLAKSTDRTYFGSDGTALTPLPSWICNWNSGCDIWAPYVVYHDNQYWQYYAVPDGHNTNHTAAIALATASSPNNLSWSDQGIVIQSSDSSSFNAIDPSLVQDGGGNWWMSYGSWNDGIHVMPLNSWDGKESGSTTYHLARRSGGIEGSQLYAHGGYYYLFASVGTCCNGTSSTYHIVVGRSTSVTGPYLDRGGIDMMNGGGTILLSAHDNIYGPGGQSVYDDGDGTILDYHYYDANNNGAPFLGINEIGWTSDGWPYVH